MCRNSPSPTTAPPTMASDSNSSDSASPLTGILGTGTETSDAKETHNIYFPVNERSKRKRDRNILHFIEKFAKETLTDVPKGGNGSVPGEGSSGIPVAPAILVNVALEGMVPVMMREGGGGEWRPVVRVEARRRWRGSVLCHPLGRWPRQRTQL